MAAFSLRNLLPCNFLIESESGKAVFRSTADRCLMIFCSIYSLTEIFLLSYSYLKFRFSIADGIGKTTDRAMSKQLLIMRHAKSSWDVPGMVDYERPLNQRGLRDVPEMASLLIEQHCVPKIILSSSAVRGEYPTPTACSIRGFAEP